ncbi:beta-N-acetylhexosaminidase [Mongoliitalea daihaiensis]|uniref:beta-N-acetylhexosaminidase n=1 Tax=Mongoliitalea daihaiensis TaxID=2782006 RepID=UPI001F321024|nr:beta-N-acetylhexosaminidase [Mongoliitalea daihaiensis]UJP64330.1 beta-N-acetylhexosaminidase [Mongoliitalea daihaiensis]
MFLAIKKCAVTLVLFCLIAWSCQEKVVEVSLEKHSIIPIPVQVMTSGANFLLDKTVKIQVEEGVDLDVFGVRLQAAIQSSTGLQLGMESESASKVIELKIDSSFTPVKESYKIDIQTEKIRLIGSDQAGLFYSIQTFQQLLNGVKGKQILLQGGLIEDYPAYAYRGMMLDVARHFFPVSDVKHLIDQLAIYKINHLHLHLSDDQGWRIEIKSWPLLTTIGGSNEVGGGDGGYYTQEEYQELVAYAAKNFITIVPEIDMPGHTNAVLNSYGILNPGIEVPKETAVPIDWTAFGLEKDANATPYHTGIDVGFSTLDIHSEVTYQFVEDVIRELAAITPGPYLHIGGDETLIVPIEDYVYFIERAQELVTKYGKITMGWDEVAHAKLLPSSIVQFWAKPENAVLAIEQGAKVLMSPAVHTYLDMKYDSTTSIGLKWAAYIELDDAYKWDPTTLDEGIHLKDILGVEAPLWTETIESRADIEYMVFPRLAAIAEIAWSPQVNRSWEDFQRRISKHGQVWEEKGINYYRSPQVLWE